VPISIDTILKSIENAADPVKNAIKNLQNSINSSVSDLNLNPQDVGTMLEEFTKNTELTEPSKRYMLQIEELKNQ